MNSEKLLAREKLTNHQGLKFSENCQNSGFYNWPQTPNSFILVQFLARFGCFPDFLSLALQSLIMLLSVLFLSESVSYTRKYDG